MMKKRGQATVFVIIGIVVLAVIILLFFFKGKLTQAIRQEPTNPQEYLAQQLDDIKKEVGRCVTRETEKASKLLMENGGSFERSFNVMRYYNVSYPILCRDINGTKGCLSEPILVSNLGDKISGRLPSGVNNCLNLEDFRNKDYELRIGNINLTSQIFDDYILVNVKMLVSLKKGANIAEADSFYYKLDIPLGTLTKAVNDLVQIRAGGNEIDPVLYGLLSMNKYKIEVRKPYPDELYDVGLTSDDKYHFYFAVEGIGRYPRPSGRVR